MKIKDWFLLFISPDSEKSYKFKVSKIFLVSFLTILFSFIFFIVYSFILYFSTLENIEKAKDVQTKNIKISKSLISYSGRIERIEKTLERIRVINSKLSIVSSLSDDERYPSGVVSSLNNIIEDFEEVYQSDSAKIEEKLKDMKQKISKLEHESILEEERVSALSDYFSAQSSLLASTPAILPARGWLTSSFGNRIDPFTGQVTFHKGMDIAARIGTPIIAPGDGIVVFTGRRIGYGLNLVIDHGYGISTRYAHMDKILVSHGTQVTRGSLIGTVGNSGRSTGPHLHYEVRLNGVPVNPQKFILDGF